MAASIHHADPPVFSVRDSQQQDWDALAQWCASQGLMLNLEQPPKQFTGGLGNLNYLVRVDGTECVLRRPPAGRLPPGANDMGREFRILSRLWREFPLAPKAFAFCEDSRVLGAPFLLMEYCAGMVIGAQPPAPLSPGQAACIGNSLVDLLVSLHAVDPAAAGLDTLGRPDGMLARMVKGWRMRAFTAWDGQPPKGLVELSDWLQAGLSALPPQTPRLLHSDFKLDNVILDPLSYAPRAVIDWDMGTRGDPLVDLSTLLSYWTQADDPPELQALQQMPTAGAGFPTRKEVIARYARATGVDISGLHFYRMIAMFKLVVVFQQLYMRYQRGEAAHPRYARFGALAQGLLEVSLQGRHDPDF